MQNSLLNFLATAVLFKSANHTLDLSAFSGDVFPAPRIPAFDDSLYSPFDPTVDDDLLPSVAFPSPAEAERRRLFYTPTPTPAPLNQMTCASIQHHSLFDEDSCTIAGPNTINSCADLLTDGMPFDGFYVSQDPSITEKMGFKPYQKVQATGVVQRVHSSDNDRLYTTILKFSLAEPALPTVYEISFTVYNCIRVPGIHCIGIPSNNNSFPGFGSNAQLNYKHKLFNDENTHHLYITDTSNSVEACFNGSLEFPTPKTTVAPIITTVSPSNTTKAHPLTTLSPSAPDDKRNLIVMFCVVAGAIAAASIVLVEYCRCMGKRAQLIRLMNASLRGYNSQQRSPERRLTYTHAQLNEMVESFMQCVIYKNFLNTANSWDSSVAIDISAKLNEKKNSYASTLDYAANGGGHNTTYEIFDCLVSMVRDNDDNSVVNLWVGKNRYDNNLVAFVAQFKDLAPDYKPMDDFTSGDSNNPNSTFGRSHLGDSSTGRPSQTV